MITWRSCCCVKFGVVTSCMKMLLCMDC